MQRWVCQAIEAAATAQVREQRKARRTGSRQETTAVAVQSQRCAAAVVDAGTAAENAWPSIGDALRLLTPTGELNSRARAEEIIAAALPA